MTKGILLDIGCGENKVDKRFTGMDKRDLPGVDIVHDLEVFPWPLEDETCLTVVASHIIEHIKPWLMLDFMNEIWRVLLDKGQLALSFPYGTSPGFIQDPTHCNPCNEATWQYFDPRFPLYGIYKPKPYHILHSAWQDNGNMEVLLEKINEQS